MKIVIAVVAALGAFFGSGAAHAQSSAGAPKKAFACSVGKKQVLVEVIGEQVVYRFGTPEKAEMSIIGSRSSNNVHYYWRGANDFTMEQVRFSNGDYSYIVHATTPKNGEVEAGSGLVVMRGNKLIASMDCTKASKFTVDLSGLPKDDEQYDTLAL